LLTPQLTRKRRGLINRYMSGIKWICEIYKKKGYICGKL
jgi:hypothetical protein